MICGSIIAGVSAGILWVSQSTYIQQLAHPIGDNLSGSLIGMFWAITQISQILGNTISLFLLEIDVKTYFLVMLLLGLIGNSMFIFLPNVQVERVEKG